MTKNRLEYLFPAAVLGVATLLAVLRISGTSVGMYQVLLYGSQNHDPDLILGEPRSIRSDEWSVWTPWTLAQAQVGFDEKNKLYAAGQDLTTSDVPVKNWVMLFKPDLWPFFILPLEQAFALSWWLRSLMLLLATYVVLLLISGRNVLVSALGAVAFMFSPYFQWWYTSPVSLVDVASFGLLASYFYVEILREDRTRILILYLVACAYFAVCFFLMLYPPGQIPMAWLFLLLGIGCLFSDRSRLIWPWLRKKLLAMGIAGALVLLALFAFYLQYRGIITTIRQTEYPGQRRIQPGTLLLGPARLLGGFYNVQLLYGVPPSPFGPNQSEAASFFMLSLFILPICAFFMIRSAVARRGLDTILLALVLFQLLALAWMTLGLPPLFAKLTLLDFTQPYRVWLALGISNLLLLYYYLYRLQIPSSPHYGLLCLAYAALVFGAVWYLGFSMRAASPPLGLSHVVVLIISLASALLLFLLLTRRRLAFTILFTAFSLASAFDVNPLYRGLGPVLNTQLSQAIRSIDKQAPPGSYWVVYGNGIFANYLAANGAHVLNGTYAYPNVQFWRSFDPSGQFATSYNRYGHMIVERPLPSGGLFATGRGDSWTLHIDPCSPLLREAGVRYYMFFEPASDACLAPLGDIRYPALHIYLYSRAP